MAGLLIEEKISTLNSDGSGQDANGVNVTLEITGEVYEDHTFSLIMTQIYTDRTAEHPSITGKIDECEGIIYLHNYGTATGKAQLYYLKENFPVITQPYKLWFITV